MRYQILCLETWEFLHEREVEVVETWSGREYNSVQHRYVKTTDIPKDAVSYSQAKIVTFLTRKKAEKWIKTHCGETGLKEHLFEIVKADG